MKLTDFLTDVGRPVAYYPGLRKITGSTTATILLCQLIYWTGKESKGDGWIYKSSEELTEETGLSYDEQVTARKRLVEAGLIAENYKRLEHRMYFQVQTDKINDLWGIPETGNAKMGNTEITVSTKAELPSSLIGNTETTTENTSKINNNQELFAKAHKEYSNNIAMLTAYSSEKLSDLCNVYSPEWVIDAIRIAVERNARNLKYISAVLQSWQEKGKDWTPEKRKSTIAPATTGIIIPPAPSADFDPMGSY